MGLVQSERFKSQEATKTLEEAMRVSIASRHDDLLPEISSNLVWDLADQRKFDDSEKWARFAEATIERGTASNPIAYAWLLNNIGVAYMFGGRLEESLEYQQRARVLKEKALGPDDPDVARTLNNIALTLNTLGRSREALDAIDRSLRIHRRILGDAHPETARDLSNRGEILAALNDPSGALKAYEEADAILEREFGRANAIVAFSLTGIGAALVGLQRPSEALEPLERALEIRRKEDPNGTRIGETEFALARALWDSHRETGRALTLAQSAVRHYGTQPSSAAQRAKIVDWLSHRAAAEKKIAAASE
jgi:tetratricopeptide (TPR) repeat protein